MYAYSAILLKTDKRQTAPDCIETKSSSDITENMIIHPGEIRKAVVLAHNKGQGGEKGAVGIIRGELVNDSALDSSGERCEEMRSSVLVIH